MIFGSDYDKSLWLILAGDKNNRDIIIKFIKSIPQELWEDIYKKLDIVQRYNRDNIPFCDRKEKHLYGCVEIDGSAMCYYKIDSNDGAITICYEKLNGYIYDHSNIFEITLYPRSKFDSMEKSDSMDIGNIECKLTLDDTDDRYEKEIEYKLRKTSLGYKFIANDKNEVLNSRFKRIDFRRMPREMYMINFSTPDRVNRLIRSKKWRKL